MAWGMSNSPDYAMVRGSIGAPGTAGWEVRQGLQYLGGPRDKLMASEAQKDRDLKLQMQAAQLGPRNEILRQLMGGGLNGMFGQVGGTIAPQPGFNPSPIYTPEQTQEQVNAARARNDARSATQQRLLGQSAAARGMGMASPGMTALARQIGTANMRENAEAERQIPFEMAQANADSMFRGQQLQQNMWQAREDSDIRRRQQQLQSITSLLGLLG